MCSSIWPNYLRDTKGNKLLFLQKQITQLHKLNRKKCQLDQNIPYTNIASLLFNAVRYYTLFQFLVCYKNCHKRRLLSFYPLLSAVIHNLYTTSKCYVEIWVFHIRTIAINLFSTQAASFLALSFNIRADNALSVNIHTYAI